MFSCRIPPPAITVNEHADPSVVEDIAAQLEAMVPQNGNYRHLEGNAPAHIKASLMGSSADIVHRGWGAGAGDMAGHLLLRV